jgi:hypothetical protein
MLVVYRGFGEFVKNRRMLPRYILYNQPGTGVRNERKRGLVAFISERLGVILETGQM